LSQRYVANAVQLASEDRYQFQWWALSLIEAQPLAVMGNQSRVRRALIVAPKEQPNQPEQSKLGLE
jgi:hypothetical protein